MDEHIRRQVRPPQAKGTLKEPHVVGIHVQKVLSVIAIVTRNVFRAQATDKMPQPGVASRQMFDETVAEDASKSAFVDAAAIPRDLTQPQLIDIQLTFSRSYEFATQRECIRALMRDDGMNVNYLGTSCAEEAGRALEIA